MMHGHRRAPSLHVVDDLQEPVGRRRGRADLVRAMQVDEVAVLRQRRRRHEAALHRLRAGAERERHPEIVAAGAAAQAEPPLFAAGRRFRGGQELVEVGRRLQVMLRQQVEPHIEIQHDVLQRHVVALAVGRGVQPPQIVGNVGLPGPRVDPFVERRQRLHLHQPRQVVEFHHRRVGTVAGDDGGVHPVVVIAAATPGDILGLDLDARDYPSRMRRPTRPASPSGRRSGTTSSPSPASAHAVAPAASPRASRQRRSAESVVSWSCSPSRLSVRPPCFEEHSDAAISYARLTLAD